MKNDEAHDDVETGRQGNQRSEKGGAAKVQRRVRRK
jgi:hypothetical protein